MTEDALPIRLTVRETGTLAAFAVPYGTPECRAHSSVVEHSPYKRGVRRFKSYCAHIFEYLIWRVATQSRRVGDIPCLNGARAVRQVDAAKEDDMCPHSWAWGPLQDGRDHGAQQAVQPRTTRTASHRSPARSPLNRKYRVSSYGLTQEQFDRLLAAQQQTCGMCREPFKDGQLIHVDHDHAWGCQRKNRSCGKCIRGLPVPYVQHRAGPHRTPIWDGSRLTWTALPSRFSSPPPSLRPGNGLLRGAAAATWPLLERQGQIGQTTRPGASRPEGQ